MFCLIVNWEDAAGNVNTEALRILYSRDWNSVEMFSFLMYYAQFLPFTCKILLLGLFLFFIFTGWPTISSFAKELWFAASGQEKTDIFFSVSVWYCCFILWHMPITRSFWPKSPRYLVSHIGLPTSCRYMCDIYKYEVSLASV